MSPQVGSAHTSLLSPYAARYGNVGVGGVGVGGVGGVPFASPFSGGAFSGNMGAFLSPGAPSVAAAAVVAASVGAAASPQQREAA
jgi:hypothetical protein